jgi:ubiquinone/menaquinone biosynthesis C-methylase UbiE
MAHRQIDYVLGHSARELERLNAQARLYEPFTTQFFTSAGISMGMRVLDVGCGGGDVSLLLAKMVGVTGEVVGVDRSARAIEGSMQRASDLRLENVRFLQGDPTDMEFGQPFDAAVGRLVLMFNSVPADMLRAVASKVRTGGIVAFQEIDFSGCRSQPVVHTFQQSVTWIAECFGRSGADPYLGLKLHRTFLSAGLTSPNIVLNAGVGANSDDLLFDVIADLVRILAPSIEQLEIARVDSRDVETLAQRMRDEVMETGGIIIGPSLVGASTRTRA